MADKLLAALRVSFTKTSTIFRIAPSQMSSIVCLRRCGCRCTPGSEAGSQASEGPLFFQLIWIVSSTVQSIEMTLYPN